MIQLNQWFHIGILTSIVLLRELVQSANDSAILYDITTKLYQRPRTQISNYETLLDAIGDITKTNSTDSKVIRKRLVFLGTNWCGIGNVAVADNSLGLFSRTDSCCREHIICESSANSPPKPVKPSGLNFHQQFYQWPDHRPAQKPPPQPPLPPPSSPSTRPLSTTQPPSLRQTVTSTRPLPPLLSPTPPAPLEPYSPEPLPVPAWEQSFLESPEALEFEQLYEQEKHEEEKYGFTRIEDIEELLQRNRNAQQQPTHHQHFRLRPQPLERSRRYASKILGRSWCHCDQAFYNCLKNVGSIISWAVGKSHFNLLHRQCQMRDHPIISCARYQGPKTASGKD